MGHVLSLTDGTTTISLVAGGVMLRSYTPRSPEIQADGLIGQVAEPIEILVYGAAESEVSAKIQAIESMLARARARFWSGVGPRVFLQLRLNTSSVTYRSEVANGSVELERGALTAFAQNKVNCTLTVTRQGFWEGERTALPLSNRNGTNNTSGLTVYNRGSGQDNWFGVSAASVTGALPAPLELWLINNTGGSREYRNFRIANNTFGPSLAHIIEGETSAAVLTQADAGSSSGAYGYFSGVSGAFEWTVDSARTSLIAGRRVHIIARMASLPGSTIKVYAQCLVLDSAGVTPLYTAPEVLLQPTTAHLHTLGTVPLPPTSYDTSGPTLKLRVNFLATSATTIGLDYIQLTPAEDGRYRHLIQRGYSVPNGASVVDDGIEGLAYMRMGGNNYPFYTARTQPVHVLPGRDQRIYILHDGDGGGHVGWTLSVQAWYRSRKITL